MILIAQHIRERVSAGDLVIRPFVEEGRAFGRSYGLSCCGYDVRLAQDVWLWPFWGRIASIIEHIAMPTDLRGKIENKSTNARIFLDASQGTNIEPGWRGTLTLELTRGLPWPVLLRAGTPIASIIFEELSGHTDKPYVGKYQDQGRDPQPAIFTNEMASDA